MVRARSAVERDGYSREIELVPGAEAPTRLVIVLDRLLAGLDAIRCDRDEALAIVMKAALDSVPALRLSTLRALEQFGCSDTNGIAGAVQHPATTTRRTLEDLTAYGLVSCERQGEGKAHRWELTEFAEARLRAFPEKLNSEKTVFISRSAQEETKRERSSGDRLTLEESAAVARHPELFPAGTSLSHIRDFLPSVLKAEAAA